MRRLAESSPNNASALGQALSRDVSHAPAIQQEPATHQIKQQPVRVNEIAQGFAIGM